MSSSRLAGTIVRPHDPLAAAAVVHLEELPEPACAELVRNGTLRLDVQGSRLRVRRWFEGTSLSRIRRMWTHHAVRNPALQTFAVLRRAEAAELRTPRALVAAKMSGVGYVLCECDPAPIIQLDAVEHRVLARNFGLTVATLHAHGFAARSVARDDFGVIAGQTPDVVAVGFGQMRWGKIVTFNARIAHLAACAAMFSGDPFGFVSGVATQSYLEASCLRESPERVIDAVRVANGKTNP